jgi:hypothetical protein
MEIRGLGMSRNTKQLERRRYKPVPEPLESSSLNRAICGNCRRLADYSVHEHVPITFENMLWGLGSMA